MQDIIRIHHLKGDGRRSAVSREPNLDGPAAANEDSWLDNRAFDQDMRALFSDEDLAAMRQPADKTTLDWSPRDHANDRRPQGAARIGAVAITLYAATALGLGLYLVLDPFGPGKSEATVADTMAAQATEVAPVLVSPVNEPKVPPTPTVPAPAPTIVPVQVQAQTAPVSQPTAAAAGPAVTPWIQQPAPANADLSPAMPPAAAPTQNQVVAQAVVTVQTAQPKTARPKTQDVFTPGQAAAHLARASSLLETGQIPAARAVLLLLAEQGNTEANYRYGRTFDPKVLATMGVVGVRGDVETARKYYGLAAAAGHTEAKQALQNL